MMIQIQIIALRYLRQDSGATAIEYSLMAAGIALAIIATVYEIGPKLIPTFQAVSDNLK